jgi:hypothetical protein
LPPPIRESVFLKNRLPFTNAYSTENLPPPLNPYQPARPQPPPTGLGLPAGPNRQAHLASQPLGPRVPLAYFAEDVFFFDSRLPFSVLSHSSLADAWAPLVSSFLHPTPADPDCATAESPHVRPLRAAAPYLEMPPEPLVAPPSLPPSSSRAITRRDEPIYSAIEATPPRRPLPYLHRPDTPPPDPIKGQLHPQNILHHLHASPELLPLFTSFSTRTERR